MSADVGETGEGDAEDEAVLHAAQRVHVDACLAEVVEVAEDVFLVVVFHDEAVALHLVEKLELAAESLLRLVEDYRLLFWDVDHLGRQLE